MSGLLAAALASNICDKNFISFSIVGSIQGVLFVENVIKYMPQ